MSDFYSVLRQSIIERDLRSTDEREAAYAQARQAMIRQLWSYDPPLAEDEIDSRIGAFDIAVQRIEDDVSKVFESMPPAPYRQPTAPVGLHEQAAVPADDDRADRGDDRLAAFLRSLDARSRAVERALSEPIEENPDHLEEADAAPDGQPRDEPDAAASEVPGRRWDERAPEPAEGDDAEPGHLPPYASAPPLVLKRPPPAARPAATGPRQSRSLVGAGAGHASRRRVQLLVGTVIVLALVLVAGIVWLFLPATSGSAVVPVKLETNVPSGVSDPAAALRIPTTAIAVTRSFTLFDGSDPTVFVGDPDNPVRYDGEAARIATSVASAGARVEIGPGLSSRLAGRTVRVTIVARSARENGASTMRFAYQSGLAISHWQTANLSPEFTPLGLVWRVPTLRTSPAGDAILIEPGIPGSGTGVEVKSVAIDLIEE
jgi:hypothetical protein